MQPWSRTTVAEYRRLTLRAHSLLGDVPLHDVWRVTLPGGGPARTMTDVRSVFEVARQAQRLGPLVRALFAFRWFLGRLFRWDDSSQRDGWTLQTRLSDADRRQSLVEPGRREGPFTVVCVHAMEDMSEILRQQEQSEEGGTEDEST